MTNLYKVGISKRGDDTNLKEIHVSANSLSQANDIAEHLVYEHMTEFDDFPIEITGVTKVMGIVIANSMCPDIESVVGGGDEEDEHEYTGSEPISMAANMPNEDVLTFKCECHEELRVPARILFPFVRCPNCNLQILRREIVNVGGIYVYEKFVPKKKN